MTLAHDLDQWLMDDDDGDAHRQAYWHWQRRVAEQRLRVLERVLWTLALWSAIAFGVLVSGSSR
jgi:hypothetical protein